MRDKNFLAVLVAVIGLMTAGAIADTDFTGSISADWATAGNWTAGVPGAGVTANVGTTGNANVSVTASSSVSAGGINVAVGANGSASINAGGTINTTRLNVGVSGGASVTGSASLSGVVNISGQIYNGTEDEYHSIDVGGGANGSLTLTAGATVSCAGQMGLGKDDRWGTDDGATHYSGILTMQNGSSLLLGQSHLGDMWQSFLTVGQGADTYLQEISTTNASLTGTLDMVGPAILEYTGTLNIIANGAGRMMTRDSGARGAATNPTVKPIGSAPIIHCASTVLATSTNGGARLDMSACDKFATWTTILDTAGSAWGSGDLNSWYFQPGTDPNWQIQFVSGGGKNMIQVQYVPEPATLALLAIGGIGALLRKRR